MGCRDRYARHCGLGDEASLEERTVAFLEIRKRRGRRSNDVGVGMPEAVEGSEVEDISITVSGGVHFVVVDVGMLEGMRVVWAHRADVHVAMVRVALGEVVVQRGPEGRENQQCCRKQDQRSGSGVLEEDCQRGQA